MQEVQRAMQLARAARLIQQNSRYIPHAPTLRQLMFLALDDLEDFYGGAAGGGKSDALLMAALMYVHVPQYAALILRRSYADLALPGAIMDRAHEWLNGTDAKWSEVDKTWTFPSGATLTFGYLQYENDKYRYQSSEFQFIGFDELTQFSESQYRYMFSRLRRLQTMDVPLRMRAASNPGGMGHEWVYERFIVGGAQAGRAFIPARLADNPHLDRAEYERSLAELDDVTKAQLLDGLWITDPAGKPFDREWWSKGRNRFALSDTAMRNQCVARWLSFDTAMKDKDSSAYTAAVAGELTPDYRMATREVWRAKLTFPYLPDKIQSMATHYNQDGKLRGVIIEDKSSGTSVHQTLEATAPAWLRDILIAFQPSGDKPQRGQQAAVWCKRDCVLLPFPSMDAPWLHDFEAELFNFPDTQYKDQVDAFAQLIIYTEHLLASGWRARNGVAA
jgi:predicted phage terminase large subunit-like protein